MRTDTPREGFEADAAFQRQQALPGGRFEVVLLHLAMGGLIVDQLTTPGALPAGDVDGTIDTLVRRLVVP